MSESTTDTAAADTADSVPSSTTTALPPATVDSSDTKHDEVEDWFIDAVKAPISEMERLAFEAGGMPHRSGGPATSAAAASYESTATVTASVGDSLGLKIETMDVATVKTRASELGDGKSLAPMKDSAIKADKSQMRLIRTLKMERGLWFSFLRGSALAALLKSESDRSSVSVIDVRHTKQDFKGGHIRGAINIPFDRFSASLVALINEHWRQPFIVFHCMYSQVRGPAACRLYCQLVSAICHGCDKYGTEQWHRIVTDDDSAEEEYGPLKEAATMDGTVNLKSIVGVSQSMVDGLLLQSVHVLDKGVRLFINDYHSDGELVADFDASYWQTQSFSGAPQLYHTDDW